MNNLNETIINKLFENTLSNLHHNIVIENMNYDIGTLYAISVCKKLRKNHIFATNSFIEILATGERKSVILT